MTLQSFYRRVPWAEMEITPYGDIRHCGHEGCPIDAAGGLWQLPGGDLKLTPEDHELIIGAADISKAELQRSINNARRDLKTGRSSFYPYEANTPQLLKDIRKRLKRDLRILKVRETFENRMRKAQR